MKKISPVFLICFFTFFVFFVLSVNAEEEKKEGEVKFYPGMEIKKVGDVNVLMAKGSKLRHENDLLVIESAEEYVSPKLIEMDKRLSGLEIRQKILENEMEQLKKNRANTKE